MQKNMMARKTSKCTFSYSYDSGKIEQNVHKRNNVEVVTRKSTYLTITSQLLYSLR